MIPDSLMALVGLLMDGFATLLPEVDLPYIAGITAWAATFSGYVRALIDDVYPIDLYLAVVREAVLVWFAGMTTFIIVKWFLRHLPVIGLG